MNTLVFTFDETLFKNTRPAKYNQLLKFYKQAVLKAKKLNYNTEIYTNSDEFDNIVDKVHLVENNEYKFWDSFKFIPLEERTDDFLLCDGDILFHDRIKINRHADVLFDAWEIANWKLVYSKDIDTLTNLGILKVIPEWVNLRQQVMNCGILKFNKIQFKNIYLDRWKTLHKFCIEHQDKLNLKKCTAIAAQYLLTILCNHYKVKRYNYSDTLRLSNSSYVHYAGSAKFKGDISAMKEMTAI